MFTTCHVGCVGRKLTDWPLEQKLSTATAVRSQDVARMRMCVCTLVQTHRPLGPDVSLLAAFIFLIVGSS